MDGSSSYSFFLKSDIDLNQLKKSFGSSNEFIKSIHQNYGRPQLGDEDRGRRPSVFVLQEELQLLASCSYDIDTEWGNEASIYYYKFIGVFTLND